ncbi:MAG: ATP-dependent sacrificial sulfur transferase LarE [Kiritimatiellaeota bacterium]|nr:ATP-dependent sacrificial sulfur transferase LarE [Kiritimatiellota bacterium]
MNTKTIIWRGAVGGKVLALRDWLRAQGGVAVGFSGGVDSSFLAVVAFQVLGRRALAVTLDTPLLARSELRAARALARHFRLRHRIVRIDALKKKALAANPPDRCYHCKKLDFARIRALAQAAGIACICDGSNADDLGDYRPGRRALAELGVQSPLQQLGFTKADIRAASRTLGLPTAEKPAMACLASRFPYGTPLTPRGLATVERAEQALRALGFRQLRVRLHGDVGRIELAPAELGRALRRRKAIVDLLHAAGLRHVALDLAGYRMGSLNAALLDSRAELPPG